MYIQYVMYLFIWCSEAAQRLQKLAAAAKRRSLPLDHQSQLGPPLEIPSPSGPACSPATLPSPHHPTWNRGVSEDRRVLGSKMRWREKNREFEPKGVDLYHPRGVTMGRGREWELPERNDSRNNSRKYSRELWDVKSLVSGGVGYFSNKSRFSSWIQFTIRKNSFLALGVCFPQPCSRHTQPLLKEIDCQCGNWLARGCLPAHQHCGVLLTSRGFDWVCPKTG